MLVKNSANGDNIWLFDLNDNRDEIKEHYHNALVLESIPNHESNHKVMHFIENQYAKMKRDKTLHKLVKTDDIVIRIVTFLIPLILCKL